MIFSKYSDGWIGSSAYLNYSKRCIFSITSNQCACWDDAPRRVKTDPRYYSMLYPSFVVFDRLVDYPNVHPEVALPKFKISTPSK